MHSSDVTVAPLAAVLWIRKKKFFFPDPDPTLTLISDPDSDPKSSLFMKNTLEIQIM